jgi:hypothetical protein
MNTTKYKLSKLVTTSALAATAMVTMLMPATASAVAVTGNAVFTIDNPAVTASIPAPNTNWTFTKHWGAADNAIAINGSTPGGISIPADSSSSALALSFQVNTNTTTAPPNGNDRTIQATTMDASNTSGGGQIGLSGAFLMSGDQGLLTPYDLNITKTAGTWDIFTNGAGFGNAKIFTLKNVTESVNGSGDLSLSGDLFWATTGFNWTAVTGADGATKIGDFSLTPAAVPVPAAVWLFGSGLLGLIATGRKKARFA